jgi:hypothetical protein
LPRLEREPADELHRHEQLALVLADLEHLHDVGVAERGHRLRLADHSRAHAFVELAAERTQHLDRDTPIESLVERRVHAPHAALPEQSQHGEAADPRGLRRTRVEQSAPRAVARLRVVVDARLVRRRLAAFLDAGHAPSACRKIRYMRS